MSDKIPSALDWKLLTLEDAFAEREPRTDYHEQEYRRGYRDGWVMAADAMHDLMFAERLPRQTAYERCWDHGYTLTKWFGSDCTKLVLPPRVPLDEPTAE